MTGGITPDDSGQGNDGTVHGAVLTDGVYANTKALSSNGIGDYVEVADDSSLNIEGITIEMWVKQISQEPNYTYLLSKAGWGSYHIISEDDWSSNQVGFTVKVGGILYRLWTSRALELAKWTYLVFVYNSGTGIQETYFNGQLDTSVSRTPGNIDTTAGSLQISNPGICSFNGVIDEVRIYSRALNTAQIKTQYYAGLNRLLAQGRIDNQEYVAKQ